MITPPALNYWPLIVTIEDVYVPELAPDVVGAVKDSSYETLAIVVGMIRLKAIQDIGAELN